VVLEKGAHCFYGIAFGLVAGMRPMKSLDLISQFDTHTRTCTFGYLSVDSGEEAFYISPADIGSRRMSKDGIQRFPLTGEIHGTNI